MLTTVVSAVLVATFVTSRQDVRNQRRESELTIKTQIANDIKRDRGKGDPGCRGRRWAPGPPSALQA
jgi:hypothetical protein